MSDAPHWVLDTNVVVSGLLCPHGPPGRLIDAVLARRLLLVLDDRIISEYREVLARSKFCFDPVSCRSFLEVLAYQEHLSAPPVKGLKAADPDDTAFLEVAAASEDKILVTGNIKHYPKQHRGLAGVLTPAEAWAAFTR